VNASAAAVGGAQRRQVFALLGLARPYLGRLAICIGITLVASAIQLTLPLGIRELFDEMIVDPDLSAIHLVTGVLLGLFLVRAVLGYIGQLLMQLTSDRIVVDLRERLFRHLHTMDIAFHQSQRVADLVSRIGSDTAAVRSVVGNLAVSLIVNVFVLVGSSALILWLNWKLALLVLAVAPLTTLVTAAFSSTFKRVSAKVQDEMAKISVVAQESLSGVDVVRSFGREAYEAARYRRGLDAFMREIFGARRADAFFNAILSFVTSASTIAIFWFGGLQVVTGAVTAGTLVAFLLYSQTIAQTVASIAQQYASFMQSMGASRRVFEILELQPVIRERADAVRIGSGPLALTLENVDFSYRPGIEVLRDISFTVAPGTTVALVGPSGSGKSTLLKLISRFHDPSGGTIKVGDHDIRDCTFESLRSSIAVVSQDVFLFGGSVRENIRYGRLDASDEEVEAAARGAHAHDFIVGFPQGYDTPVGERGLQLSGGQRQRISIARALLKNAPILLLDEATSSIDGASEQLIQESMDNLKAHRTTIVVAHRLATIRDADQILVLEAGRIVWRPSFAELTASDTMRSAGSRFALDVTARHEDTRSDADSVPLASRSMP
jgi:ATP-binding cassette, subfamily B, bacterial MsbA